MFKKLTAALVAVGLLAAGLFYTTLPSEPSIGSTVRIDLEKSLGSGVHLKDGYILTAAHVVKDVTEVEVTKQNGEKVKAKVIWTDEASDLAMIKIEDYADLKVKEVACRVPVIGEEISSVGNPFGINFIHTYGHVAGEPRQMYMWEWATPTDITILPGMSGGPTYDRKGKVIGINVGLKPFNGGATGLTIIVPGNKICEEMKEHNGN